MKALVTGLTGFAGGHLAEHLLSCGDQVLGLAQTADWPPNAPKSLRSQVQLAAWDIIGPPPAATWRRMQDFDADCLFHLAGISVPSDCGRDEPTRYAMEVNVGGVRQVIDVARRLDSRPRLIFVSSCQVYHPLPPENPVVTEEAPTEPTAPYAVTKRLGEQMVLEAADKSGLEAIILRAFNHTGPRQDSRLMLPEWASQLARSGRHPLQVISLDSYLDLTDVRDIVRAYRKLAKAGASAEVYNVGGGRSVRSGDVLEILLKLQSPPPRIVERAPGVQRLPIAELTKTQSVINWRPEIPLDQTIEDTMHYWMEQLQ